MSGSFAIGLIEILAYLIPGGLVLGGILYVFAPTFETRVSGTTTYQIAFIALSYVIGHLLTLTSVFLVKLRAPTNWLRGLSEREKRIPYYSELRNELKSLLKVTLNKDEEFSFSLRLITEYQPKASLIVDRLYALTLFARNTSLSFLLLACVFLRIDWSAVLVFIILAILFFIRYIQLESAAANTVLRAAYVYLRSKDKEKQNVVPENA